VASVLALAPGRDRCSRVGARQLLGHGASLILIYVEAVSRLMQRFFDLAGSSPLTTWYTIGRQPGWSGADEAKLVAFRIVHGLEGPLIVGDHLADPSCAQAYRCGGGGLDVVDRDIEVEPVLYGLAFSSPHYSGSPGRRPAAAAAARGAS